MSTSVLRTTSINEILAIFGRCQLQRKQMQELCVLLAIFAILCWWGLRAIVNDVKREVKRANCITGSLVVYILAAYLYKYLYYIYRYAFKQISHPLCMRGSTNCMYIQPDITLCDRVNPGLISSQTPCHATANTQTCFHFLLACQVLVLKKTPTLYT